MRKPYTLAEVLYESLYAAVRARADILARREGYAGWAVLEPPQLDVIVGQIADETAQWPTRVEKALRAKPGAQGRPRYARCSRCHGTGKEPKES